MKVFENVIKFWEGEIDYESWHESQGVLVPKKSNATDPNKYRIISLMDVYICSKILSRILTERSYKLLKKHGTKYQIGATQNSGCQDRKFTLKTLLHLRRQRNKEIYVVFTDLVKAFNIANHKLIINILERYGAP